MLVAVDLMNDVPHFNNALRVKTVDGFVKNQQVGFADQCQRNAETLLHTERKLPRCFIADMGESHKRQLFLHVFL